MDKTIKSALNYTLKLLTIIFSLVGVTISLIQYKSDGYSHWSKRLLYFTAQSNLWLAVAFFPFLFTRYIKRIKSTTLNALYFVKYVFTVCITVTLIVFTFILIPFADQSHHIWSISSILTHLLAPICAILDFILDNRRVEFSNGQTFWVIFPPVIYTLTALLLSAIKFDFGRGDSFPYPFMDVFAPSGMFGFSNKIPMLGTFYWVIILALITLGVGFLYRKINQKKSARLYAERK